MGEDYKIKVDTWGELLACILDGADRTKERQDEIKRKHAIFLHKLQNAWSWLWDFRKFIFQFNTSVNSVQQTSHLNIKI